MHHQTMQEVFKSPYIEGGVFSMEVHPPELMPEHHVHGHIELNYLTDCHAEYVVNGQKIKVPDDRVILFWANMPHQMVKANPEGRMLNIYIPLPVFLKWKLQNQLQAYLLSQHIIIAPKILSPSSEQLGRWLSDYQSEDSRFRELMIQELSLLFKRLCLMHWQSIDTGRSPGPISISKGKTYKHLAEIIHFIGENLDKPISTTEVAEHLGLHRNYTVNLFKRVMGTSIKKYIQYQRLQSVQSMLIDTDKPISEIAFSSGFNSLGRFYDAFSRHYGIAPSQFRKQFKLSTQA